MTGYRSRLLRHECTRMGCYLLDLPAWDDILDTLAPYGVWPTDVDGLLEVNRHCLYLEQKRAGVPIPRGQVRAFQELATRPRSTVVCFRPTGGRLELLRFPHPEGWQVLDRADFLRRLDRWVRLARGSVDNPPGGRESDR